MAPSLAAATINETNNFSCICEKPDHTAHSYVLTEIMANEAIIWWSGRMRYPNVCVAHQACVDWQVARGLDKPGPDGRPLYRFRAAERKDYSQIRDLLEDEERARAAKR